MWQGARICVGLFAGLLLTLLSSRPSCAQSEAPRIDVIKVGPRLTIRSLLGFTNEILCADSPVPTQWVPLTNFVVTQSPFFFVDQSAPLPVSRFYRVRAFIPTPTNMALVPAGEFVMGDALAEGDADERPLHTVYLGAYRMDRSEVSKALWDEVKNWSAGYGYAYDHAGSGKAANHPVQMVSWYDVVKWCNARSEKEGRPPVYFTDAALTQVYRSGQTAPYARWNVAGYRLPTEAEWEQAARGGLNSRRFPWGDTIAHTQANYCSRTNESYDVSATRSYHPAFNDGTWLYTSPAGYFAPNGRGLHDLTGNVWEWCWDWYGSYASGTQTDPRGPATGTKRTNRGGSWFANADGCRGSDRSGLSPTNTYNTLGFRTVLPDLQP